MRVTDSMARPGWNGKSRVFTPTLSYFLRMWGAFEGVFTLLIACSGPHSFLGWLGCVGMSCALYAREGVVVAGQWYECYPVHG